MFGQYKYKSCFCRMKNSGHIDLKGIQKEETPVDLNVNCLGSSKKFIPSWLKFIPTSSQNIPTSLKFLPSSPQNLPTSLKFLPSWLKFLPSSSQNIPSSLKFQPTSLKFQPTFGVNYIFIHSFYCLNLNKVAVVSLYPRPI